MTFIDIYKRLFCASLEKRLRAELAKTLHVKLDMQTKIEESKTSLGYHKLALATCDERIARLNDALNNTGSNQ